ncbi:tRNA lysidine(34) synthetase TilS [Ruania alba]|uniref:tRNA(Ile)-lysidine synthase n=1 Tax=Ruania alba TaxID=648782 RepID=A0A1H5MRW3_9MICO|nr:tRNA lysidine(34) synthetase TilS [Ruania alba]SEE92026.1 tRNA(Ile)-lysidine synthase [Ruania alba]
MPGPQPPVARVRHTVRTFLDERLATGRLRPGDLLLVACSGGPDSLALAAATAFVAPRLGLRAGAVVVDHGLQGGSATIADTARAACADLDLEPATVVRVQMPPDNPDGPEGGARAVRYNALTEEVARTGAAAVLLGHTRDDQAETVLLALARGSGTRSLAGMAAVREPFWRPLLSATRADTHAVCEALGLPVWHDPSNAVDGPWRTADGEPLRRSAIRHVVLPTLTEALGPGVPESLARTAELARADAVLLDELTDQAWERLACSEPNGTVTAPVGELAEVPTAVRRRLLRRLALAAGCPGGALSHAHTERMDALVIAWTGQGPVHLPGGIDAVRTCGRLVLRVGPARPAR